MATLAKAPAKKAAAKKSASTAVAKTGKAPVAKAPAAKALTDTTTTLTITSKNYSSWSLRGWLLTRFAGLPFEEHVLPPDDPSTRAEILLLSSSILVPCLEHKGIRVWDTLAIAEYLNEVCPDAHLLPLEPKARAHCRAISGEMHSGFSALRSSLPMNLRNHFPKFKIWSRAQADIDRITAIWRDCLSTYGGPFLFGAERTIADAMYAPVCTRFLTYDVKVDPVSQAYCELMLNQPEMKEWLKGAKSEPLDIDELDVEF
ncbi:MAG: glutathione S-transferase family protein [Aquabacterium sp.]|uniref:glutathione S-transferase family protein n=1 Tax=Aquabacterium sp. TaxID=1872578 RepID=UPI00121F0BF3|nr:glutathione S-transferase family protein [Aquabacterium sp.]TAK94325.1 MAG: glutathione S-transferase family protein [Aquabacterium sp.]